MANSSQQINEQIDADIGGLQFENLYPVLLQTFVVIVLGYVALNNRTRVIIRPWLIIFK